MRQNDIEAIYPLSPVQQGMLFHSGYGHKSGIYVETLHFNLQGALNVSAFKRAWQEVIERYSVLRTFFVWKNRESPLQIVRRQADLPWQEYDWGHLSAKEQQEQIRTLLKADREQGFDLSKAPLMRLTLIQQSQHDYRFIWSHHHIILDGWSEALLLKEVFAIYRATCQGEHISPEQPRPFKEYITWLQKQDLSKAEPYWREKLSGFTTSTPIGSADEPDPLQNSDRMYDQQQRRLPKATTQALQSLSQQHQLTLNTLVQGAWALLLGRYSGQTDVVFGSAVSGRSIPFPGIESMVGLFINTLPVRVQIPPHASLIPWLKELQMQQVKTRQFEHSSLRDIQSWSALPRSQGDSIFDSILSFNNFPLDSILQELSGNLEIRDINFQEGSHYPISVLINPGEELLLRINYDCQRLKGTTIAQMLRHFHNLLEAIAANPFQTLSAYPLLTDAEIQQLLVDFNQTEATLPAEKTVVQLFEKQAAQTPDAVALRFDGHTLTYTQLNQRANQLAHYLRRYGVGPGKIVALCLNRSPEAVIAIWAALKAGASYVPLDATLPEQRLAFMLDETQAPVILTTEHLAANLPESNAEFVYLDPDFSAIESESEENPSQLVGPDDRAYIIYTSGSTGTPKGAMLCHRNLINYVWWAKKFYLQGEALDFPLFSSLSFDLTVTSIFLPLISGGSLIIYGENGASNLAILDVIKDNLVDIIKLTPAHLSLIKEINPAQTRLRKMIVGGEDFKRGLAKSVSDMFGGNIEIYNEYGPTEATVGCMIHRFDPDTDLADSVPIGRPINNAQIYILDEQLNPVPSGVIGEMCVGGAGVARGYLNRPDLTAAKFVEDPRQPGATLYRTGDLARWTPDGQMQFLGRADHQVKVKGYRVELGEIESNLLAHPDIEAAVVTVVQPQVAPSNGAVKLCAKCGLPDNYPGASLDAGGVCNTCHDFDVLKDRFQPYFKTPAELQVILDRAKQSKTGKYDCMVLYSGGKDSSYMLYQLVKEFGMTPLVFSLENGYISAEAKENIRRVTDDLGVDLVFGQTPHMNAVFVDSLKRHSNVCDGCFKVIYTLSINLAREKGIKYIFTGLARGQLFETRLSDMFEARIFDVDEIDRTVLAARKAYHRIDDAVTQLLDVEIFKDDTIFDEIKLVDFYRYTDVPLNEMYRYLDQHAPWVRPSDTGRSTNCLINDVGIYIHQKERGYHNYALPYSWDVRVGHKTRSEAIDDLNDDIDEARVRQILTEIGYDEPETGRTQLAAYFVANQSLTTTELRQFLSQRLPSYMIPTYFVPLDQMPLTTNGKIDRTALPDPTQQKIRLDTEFVAPVTANEKTLAKIWAEVFHLEHVGVHDNFFDLGGDSIISIQIIAKAGQAGLIFSPQQLFNSETIANLAPLVEVSAGAQVEQGLVSGPAALTPIQHWLFGQNLPEPDAWNMSLLVDVTTDIQPHLLEQALQQVLVHHDVLRARFLPADVPVGWQQTIAENAPPPTFQVNDLTGLPEAEQQTRLEQTMAQLEASHTLAAGRLIAAAYFTGAIAQPNRLFISVHHLAVDGFSWNILLQDLEAVYHQLSRGEPVSLPPKTVSMKGWADGLIEVAQTPKQKQELSHWLSVFDGVQPNIPTDFQSGDNSERSTGVVTVSLDTANTESLLKEVPSAYNTQINDILLTALAQTITEWSGQTSTLIDLEGHGREDILPNGGPPARTVGWFTSIFPVKLTLPGSGHPGKQLKAIKEQLRAIPNKGIGFGLLRYLCRDETVRRQLADMPAPQVLFNYLGQMDTALPDTAMFQLGHALVGWHGGRNPRAHILEINTWIIGGQLQASWTYSKNLHHPVTIERLAGQYMTILKTLIDHCLSPDAGGYTPSDFPLANLDEAKLDRVASILDSLE